MLYAFSGGSDGAQPYAGLMRDSAGNLYGTTYTGGLPDCAGGYGCGVLFKVAPDGTETVLYSFTNGRHGAGPYAAVIADKTGNLYGTTYYGGASGYGTVFKFTSSGALKTLYNFKGGNDGSFPLAGLIRDKNGDFFGTTSYGGTHGNGTVFELAPHGVETVLYSFSGKGDGGHPSGGLLKDSSDNLYGTTHDGNGTGCGGAGCGTIFRIAVDGTETTLYAFKGGTDGANSNASLTSDSQGNLYGTTEYGGALDDGTVFRLTPDGTETVLYSFTFGGDGAYPTASLILDKNGNLYGTTYAGNGFGCFGLGCGSVFKLSPSGSETTLYDFTGQGDGGSPYAGLIKDSNGYLYGTASTGGNGGTVFKLQE